MHFVAFKSAFNMIWRKELWKMRTLLVNPHIVEKIKELYDGIERKVTIGGNLTNWFQVRDEVCNPVSNSF